VKSEPKTFEVQDIIRLIDKVVVDSGFQPGAATTKYAVVDGFGSGEKTRTLVFTVQFRQSDYRGLNRVERGELEKRVKSCTPSGFGVQIFKDGDAVLMQTGRASHRRPVNIVILIENDEAGRPSEVRPSEMFPEIRRYATAPLDAMFGLYTRQQDDMFGARNAKPFSVSAVMSALVADPIWSHGECQLLPLPTSKGGELLKHVRATANKVRQADKIRAKSWEGVLRLAVISEGYSEIASVRQKWVDEHGKYESIDNDTGTCFTLPAGGPPSPNSSGTARKLAAACVRTLEELSSLQGTEATLSLDMQSMNTLKELQAMALGFLAIRQTSLDERFEPYWAASGRGRELIAYTAWPL
jgi:hypothetical protein